MATAILQYGSRGRGRLEQPNFVPGDFIRDLVAQGGHIPNAAELHFYVHLTIVGFADADADLGQVPP